MPSVITSSLNLDHDTGQLWRFTKALNEDATVNHRPTVLEEDDIHHTGRRAANLLANAFETESTIKVPSPRRKEGKEQLIGKLSQQTNPSSSPPMMSDLTMSERNDAIKRLKNKNAPGEDGVSNEMIKHLGPAAKTKLLDIFNLSWKTGVFPPALIV